MWLLGPCPFERGKVPVRGPGETSCRLLEVQNTLLPFYSWISFKKWFLSLVIGSHDDEVGYIEVPSRFLVIHLAKFGNEPEQSSLV